MSYAILHLTTLSYEASRLIWCPSGTQKGTHFVVESLTELSFGEWLKRRRKAAGLTQVQLARQISCSTSALKKLEAEERRPSAQIAERLAQIFHIAPDERSAFLRFSRGDWQSAPSTTIATTPWRVSTPATRSNLPATTTSLIGREKEINGVHSYLLSADIRLVTLIGPPGIGKTRLSLASGRALLPDFPDGVFFIPLAPLEDPNLIVPVLVQTLGYVKAGKLPAYQQLVQAIGDKQVLLVIDNCEHLIEDVAPLLAEILSACPWLKILATSREPLRIPGEWLYPVPTLTLPASNSHPDIEAAANFSALTLFSERARAARSDFTLNDDNIQSVTAICTQLDGLPLAIELIAARVRLLSPQALLERLSGEFVLSADGMRAVPVRQKTLYNAIGWSYALLSAEEQQLFAYLAVFTGGFTLEAAESIFSVKFSDKSISALITSLSDKSLLRQSLDARGDPRLLMLVTIRQFALDRLRRAASEAEARDWHLAYFLDLAEQAETQRKGAGQLLWLNRLETEHYNLIAALQWALENENAEVAARLAGSLGEFWAIRGYLIDGRYWLDKVLIYEQKLSTPLLAKLFVAAGRVAFERADFIGAKQYYIRSLALWRETGQTEWIAELLTRLGRSVRQEGDYANAVTYYEESLALNRQLGDKSGVALALNSLGYVAQLLGDYVQAKAYAEESLTIRRQLDERRGIAASLNALAEVARLQGEHERAQQLYEECLSLCRELGDRRCVAGANHNLGHVTLLQGNYKSASELFKRGLKLYQGLGNSEGIALCLAGIAGVTAAQGKPEQAARLFAAAEVWLEMVHAQLSPADRFAWQHNQANTQAQLDQIAFHAAWAIGRTLSLDEAIHLALTL